MIVATLKTYLAVLKTERKVDKYFFWDNIMYSIRSMLEPLVLCLFWFTIAQFSNNVNPGNIALYFICYALVMRLTNTWVHEDLRYKIQDGNLSQELLKPIAGNFIALQQLHEISLRRARVRITLPATIILIYVLHFFIPMQLPNWHQLLFFPFAVISSLTIDFCFGICVSGTAFWLHHNEGIIEFIESIIPFLNGSYIPLIFLSGIANHIVKLLPFRYTLSFPLEILSTPLSSTELWQSSFIMLFWTIVLIISATIVWKKGIKVYQG